MLEEHPETEKIRGRQAFAPPYGKEQMSSFGVCLFDPRRKTAASEGGCTLHCFR
jgi:hypothetical protein